MARADGVSAALFNRARARSHCLPVRVTQSRRSDARTRTVAAKMNQNIIIDTGRLIEEVRCRPLLWDSSDELYKNKDAKNKAWEEVGEALFGEHYIKKDKGMYVLFLLIIFVISIHIKVVRY